MNNGDNKGSIWRIWDLHVHSPATYGGDYKTFINNAESSIASVIGINDYCTLNGYKEVVKLGGIPGKVIFPVIEFRMHNIVANRKNADPTKKGTKINFHVIFDNDPEQLEVINTWANSLECFDEKGETIQLGTAKDLMKVTFDYEKVIASLKKLGLYDSRSLLWLPYDEYGGIDDIDPEDNFFKLSLINKAHIIGSSSKKQADFFKWKDPTFTSEKYKEWFEKPKPCIKGSDAHEINYPFGLLRNQQSQPIDRHCWINADTTFQGLKQIIVEPERVFIGDEPDVIKRVKSNPTKFIKSLAITKCVGTVIDDVWFNDFKIELNSSLVAIIGNKGGGKSALADVLGLCGNTYREPQEFSFLTDKKFRKSKPYNLSEKFEACLTWHDNNNIKKKLSEDPDRRLPERVKYIPQNFLERLCANVDSDDFEKELRQIIFSHTPPDKRLGKFSLDELMNYKSSLVIEEIAQIQAELSKLNLEIISLEQKTSEDYKQSIENKLQLKKDELTAHEKNKPQKPVEGEQDENSKRLVLELSTYRESITKLEEEIVEHKKNKAALSIRFEELNRAAKYYKNIDEQLKKNQATDNEFFKILTKNNIVLKDIFTYTVNTEPLNKLCENIQNGINSIDKILDANDPESKVFSLNKLQEILKNGQEELDKPAKAQQKYLDEAKVWEEQRKIIEGINSEDGSLNFFKNQLNYLNNNLIPELTLMKNERKKLAENLYAKKLSLLDIRKELYQPVTEFISEFKELRAKYDVKIDVALELKSFADSFFNLINQGKTGSFCGKQDGYKRLTDLIEKTHFDTSIGFTEFTYELLDNLKHDKRFKENTAVDLNSQLKKGVELSHLYDFIYNAEYLQPVFNLKLGSKTLQELSPGERGALLLIFYLILDKDDIPLIIDQPEENLDNESVYHILVHFIKKVKEKRQIIIVTHNPNLAIVCDADQIIHMQIEKENKNTVKFYSGAIEDNITNLAAVNILEGTLPAFNNRDLKYVRN